MLISAQLFMAAVKQEFHLEEDKYYTEDEYVEEEEEEEDEGSSPEKGSKKKGRGEPRMKMRRIFRITHGRERQRGEALRENRSSEVVVSIEGLMRSRSVNLAKMLSPAAT